MRNIGYYGGSNNVARKAKFNIYYGDKNNIARRVKKGYYGDKNNIARLFYVNDFNYVSLGDSIAVGYSMPDWGSEAVEYGVNGNTSTKIVANSYTDLIRQELAVKYGTDNIKTTSFARSGDTTAGLIEKLSHARVIEAVEEANLITVCIGANDILGLVPNYFGEYIDTGDLTGFKQALRDSFANLADDNNEYSYHSLLSTLTTLNPTAKIVFTTVYNPYKYAWAERGDKGIFETFVEPVDNLTAIPEATRTAFKNWILNNFKYTKLVYERINGANGTEPLCEFIENAINDLNNIIKEKVQAFANCYIADTKPIFESVPDREINSEYHYNDLVFVDITRGYDAGDINWSVMWEDTVVVLPGADKRHQYYMNMLGAWSEAWLTSDSERMDELEAEIWVDLARTLFPYVDAHPRAYGHYALYRSFADVLDWQALTRYTITYNANGGSGSMATQQVIGLNNSVFAIVKTNAFIPDEGYYLTGWSASTGIGVGGYYDLDGNLLYYYIYVNENTTLYAQWSNIYKLFYTHTNKSEALPSDSETGPQENEILKINDGAEEPDLGAFSNSGREYYKPYGTKIEVTVKSKNGRADSDITYNGSLEAGPAEEASFVFYLTANTTVNMIWKTYGIVYIGNWGSWWDCEITTQ